MNIVAEKEAVIRLINKEEDLSVIQAIKELLQSGHVTDILVDAALEKELDISIMEADREEELSYEDVSAELRKKYAA